MTRILLLLPLLIGCGSIQVAPSGPAPLVDSDLDGWQTASTPVTPAPAQPVQGPIIDDIVHAIVKDVDSVDAQVHFKKVDGQWQVTRDAPTRYPEATRTPSAAREPVADRANPPAAPKPFVPQPAPPAEQPGDAPLLESQAEFLALFDKQLAAGDSRFAQFCDGIAKLPIHNWTARFERLLPKTVSGRESCISVAMGNHSGILCFFSGDRSRFYDWKPGQTVAIQSAILGDVGFCRSFMLSDCKFSGDAASQSLAEAVETLDIPKGWTGAAVYHASSCQHCPALIAGLKQRATKVSGNYLLIDGCWFLLVDWDQRPDLNRPQIGGLPAVLYFDHGHELEKRRVIGFGNRPGELEDIIGRHPGKKPVAATYDQSQPVTTSDGWIRLSPEASAEIWATRPPSPLWYSAQGVCTGTSCSVFPAQHSAGISVLGVPLISGSVGTYPTCGPGGCP